MFRSQWYLTIFYHHVNIELQEVVNKYQKFGNVIFYDVINVNNNASNNCRNYGEFKDMLYW